MQICLACSTATPSNTGRFCPECGAVLTAQLEPGFDPTAATRAGSSRDSAAASLIGVRIDGFVIESVLGGGSFGTVYRATQLGLDRAVAFKVPTMEIASDPVSVKRFAREARSAARIDHPGVVAIYAVGELPDSRPYLAMQLLEGQPLDKILDHGPLEVPRALELARQIASALAETHAQGVIHRDLKPTNVVWRRDRNGDDRLTLVDFGIAVCKPGSADATRLTAAGLIGTPHYMSPEQAHGDAIDARADLYALGCLLFELVTATTPFSGSGFEVLLAHLGKPPPKPSDRNPQVPELVDRLVAALLAKRPDDRIQTADEVVDWIDEALAALGDTLTAPAPIKRVRRPTAATRRDTPAARAAIREDDDLDEDGGSTRRRAPTTAPLAKPPSRVAWLVLGLGSAIAVVGGAFALGILPLTQEVARSPTTRVPVYQDRGDLRLRVDVPDPLTVGRAWFRLELRNKLGAAIVADKLIITIEDINGAATAIRAYPRSDNEQQFGFNFDFARAGNYHLRVIPPEDIAGSPTTFDVPLRVEAAD